VNGRQIISLASIVTVVSIMARIKKWEKIVLDDLEKAI